MLSKENFSLEFTCHVLNMNKIINTLFLKKFIRFEDKLILKVLFSKTNKIYSRLTSFACSWTTYILHQNDSTWSPILFRWSPQIGVANRGSYIHDWDSGSNCKGVCLGCVPYQRSYLDQTACTQHNGQRQGGPLSQSYIWSSSGHAYFSWSSEQKRWTSTIILMKYVVQEHTKLSIVSKFFGFEKRTFNINCKYLYLKTENLKKNHPTSLFDCFSIPTLSKHV